MCLCAKERETDTVTSQHISYLNRSVYVREREKEKGSHFSVCVCVWEREGERARDDHSGVQCVRNHLNLGLCANTYELHHCVCHATLFSSRLELMVKLRTLLTVFTFIVKAEIRVYWKGRYISDSCLWCSTNHYALCQLANQSRLRLSGGGTL